MEIIFLILFEEVESDANLLASSFFVFSRVFLFCVLMRVFYKVSKNDCFVV